MGRTLDFESAMANLVDTPWGTRNRIINGAMEIDQRRAGASFSPVQDSTRKYACDRWAVQNDATGLTVQQVSDAPAGLRKSLKVTVTSPIASGQCFISQHIEGLAFSPLAWGTASAIPVTLSFWVKSSVTGTFTAGIEDAAGTRCYPATFVVTSANTWERKVITIAGETSGANWGTGNDLGAGLYFDLGCANTQAGNAWGTADNKRATGATRLALTNGATFQITGVQFEHGQSATPFERLHRAAELVNCLRYFEKSYDTDAPVGGSGNFAGCWRGLARSISDIEGWTGITFQVAKRTNPTMKGYAPSNGAADTFYDEAASGTGGTPGFVNVGTRGVSSVYNSANNFTAGHLYDLHWTADAEL